MKQFRGLCSFMLISHLFPLNLHCMFYWFLLLLHNMVEAIIFIIASLCCIKNEVLEKLCWISLLHSINRETEHLKSSTGCERTGWNWWIKVEELNPNRSHCRLVLYLSQILVSRMNQPNHFCLPLISFFINEMRWHCYMVVQLPPPQSK